MKKTFDLVVWFMTICFVAVVFMMPKSIPLHWNLHWQIDMYGSRYYALLPALLPLVVYYGMLFTKKKDPMRNNFQKRERTYDLYRYIITFFMMIMNILLNYMILYSIKNIDIIILSFIGFMLIVIGNYMPRLPQNYFLGLKTPWTLSHEYVWRQTHKIGGYGFVVCGLLFMICSMVHLYYVMIIVLVLMCLFIYCYSYWIFKKINGKY